MPERNLTNEETDGRVAILKRFRELLTEQRDKFRNYLSILDNQKKSIEKLNADELDAHIELEERLTYDILSIQKCIDPMRAMFNRAFRDKNPAAGDIEELNRTLDNLRLRTAERVKENKKLIEERMKILQSEIRTLRSNPFMKKQKQVYSGAVSPSFVDIKG